ncbi:MAG: hypothetical protein ABH863_03835 [Candidatus Micrarchaeota archaeon]
MKMRGQSALEYLVTYGWAILAIVIIAAVLWYTGVFNPSKFRGGNECGGFGAFTCIDQAVTTLNTTIVLGNALGRSITLGAVSLTGNGAPLLCVAHNVVGGGASDINVASTGKVYIECDSVVGMQSSDAYDWIVSLTYTDTQSTLTKTDAGGFVRGKVG